MIGSVRRLPILLLLITPSRISEADVCAQPYSNTVLPPGVQTIGLTTTSLNSDQESALNRATQQWNLCGGATADFSTSGGGDLNVDIMYKAEATITDCGGEAVCGCFDWNVDFDSTKGKNVITGGSVKIFRTSLGGFLCGLDAAGPGLNAIMVHELGHVLGLDQAPETGCSGRPMAPQISQMGDVNQSDCDGAMMAAALANESPSGGGDEDPLNQDCEGGGCSPILVDLDRRGFDLTSPDWGVSFDVDGDGELEDVSWTRGDDGFLALDRNGNGRIDDGRELFGNFTEQPTSREPNGYLALAVFDDPSMGGNHDGLISQGDAVFEDLRVWIDGDRDGETDRGELVPLVQLSIEALSLDYWISGRRDRYGNEFRYTAMVRLRFGSSLSTDVILATRPSR